HVADVACVAPVLGAVARLELHQTNLSRPFAVDLLPDVGADLLPLHAFEVDSEWTHDTPLEEAAAGAAKAARTGPAQQERQTQNERARTALSFRSVRRQFTKAAHSTSAIYCSGQRCLKPSTSPSSIVSTLPRSQ